MNKQQTKEKLNNFINEYNIHREDLKSASEQTMRSWIDKLLSIFDWDCKDTMYVEQEKMLTLDERTKLKSIKSKHSKPDYTLKNGRARVNFLDAKDLRDNIKQSKEIAFQARSYGWSANLICSIVTNVEEIAFYNCSKIPHSQDAVELDRIYLTIDQYIENFDILYDLLYRENVLNGNQYNYLKANSSSNIKKVNLDDAFAKVLSDFRLELAESIFNSNEKIINNDSELLSKIVQSIINRIIFIRICEGRKLEEEKSLVNLLQGNFWNNFTKKNKEIYEKEYDGPVFYQIRQFDSLLIDNDVFESFVEKLYEPYPYRFDVIPTELLASMYERFISSEIFIEVDRVKQRKKSYIKGQGIVSTPKYMVDFLLDRTFEQLNHIQSLNKLFDLKILEPACGSGTFLLGILDYLENKAIELYRNGNIDENQKKLFVTIDEINGIYYPTIELRKLIINNCIYGIDMDYQAVEVSKLSLALKVIDNFSLNTYNDKFGLNNKLLLNNIGKNIIHGNTLIEYDIESKIDIKLEELNILVPLDIKTDDSFATVFKNSNKKGFDYIIGNPPYAEPKSYNDNLPYCREYFKKKYSFDAPKADMSIYFIERAIQLLNDNGQISFLCQKRFFKTEYGQKTRSYLSENKLVDTIIDFSATDIFSKKSTYLSIIILNKSNQNKNTFNYLNIKDNSNIIKNNISQNENFVYLEKDIEVLRESTWNLDNETLEGLILKLNKKYPTLDDLKKQGVCDIHVGIQPLRDAVYHIKNYKFDGDYIVGNNRMTKDDIKKYNSSTYVKVEKEICKALLRNENFNEKFQIIKPTNYVICPYKIITSKDKVKLNLITFEDIKLNYPDCAEYLSNQRNYLIDAVKDKKFKPNQDDWHKYLRTTSLKRYDTKKIVFPMTKKELIASYTNIPIYLDNTNMLELEFINEDEDFYLAMTAIFNSKILTVMAIYYSNPQSGRYKKMSKQFILPIVLPYDNIKGNPTIIQNLKKYSIELFKLVEAKRLLKKSPAINRAKIRNVENLIEKMFSKIDNDVYNLYGLEDLDSRKIIDDEYNKYMNEISKLN